MPQSNREIVVYDRDISPRRHSRGKAMLVYGLVDPRDSKVFYIGITNNLYHRFKEHVNMCGNNKRKQARIQAILDAHMLPWMLTLEVVDAHVSAREREIVWIQAYVDEGFDLLNSEIGEE